MNTQNLEFKAILRGEVARCHAVLQSAGYSHAEYQQTDTFLNVPEGYLKFSVSENHADLVRYHRTHSPDVRVANIRRVALKDQHEDLSAILMEVNSPVSKVTKARKQFRKGFATVNIDYVDGLGWFVEVSVELGQVSVTVADNMIAEVRDKLNVRPNDHIAPSYPELISAKNTADLLKQKLKSRCGNHPLILVDGASGTGKTTFRNHVLSMYKDQISYARRVTTRQPRVGEVDFDVEYVFIDANEFTRGAMRGDFLEYRDFEFGMSYGLPFQQIEDAFSTNRAALGLINLGNLAAVKLLWPEAFVVMMVTEPAVVERRLRGRGGLNEAQVEERLANARRALQLAPGYDHIINNNSDDLTELKANVDEVLSECLP